VRLNPIMLAFAALALGGAAHAAEQLETIEVKDLRQKLQQSGMLKDEIQQTEVISAKDIERKQAGSVNEAINNETGVTVSSECSMCGVKRVMINGLKGEHTTVLVDGVPTHTMASGFYGLDGVSTSGVERIEIARGAGASLIAPESVGGTINIVTKRPTENGAEIDLSAGENGYQKYGLSATGVTKDGKTRGLVAAQYDNHDQEDADGNGVNEAPMLENYSVSGKVSHDLTAKDNVELRVLSGRSEVFGGPMLGDTTQSIAEALANHDGNPTFAGDDVRRRYTGLPGDTTEYIKTDRQELVGKWLHEFGAQTNVGVTLMRSESKQDSFYEGIDYVADDKTHFADVRVNHFLNAEHLLTVGVDHRNEDMRSRSRTMEAFVTDGDPGTNYVSDSFDYTLTGLYLQDTWTPASSLEIAAAVRLDKVKADFVDASKPGTEIDETMIAPRLHVRYDHDKQWTSRLQMGRGYRAPLSFFESDHGILDAGKGFAVEVDALEKSTSASYALSYNNQRLTSTASVAWNQIENLAALAGRQRRAHPEPAGRQGAGGLGRSRPGLPADQPLDGGHRSGDVPVQRHLQGILRHRPGRGAPPPDRRLRGPRLELEHHRHLDRRPRPRRLRLRGLQHRGRCEQREDHQGAVLLHGRHEAQQGAEQDLHRLPWGQQPVRLHPGRRRGHPAVLRCRWRLRRGLHLRPAARPHRVRRHEGQVLIRAFRAVVRSVLRVMRLTGRGGSMH